MRRRLAGTPPAALLALAALLSLFVRSERYPQVISVASAAVRLQDVLFVALVATATLRAGRPRQLRPVPVLAAAFAAALVVATLRSPVREAAVVSVAKFAEFVIVGAVIALVLRRESRRDRVTAMLAMGAVANALYGSWHLVRTHGVTAFVTGRSDALLGSQTAAIAVSVAIVWFVAGWSEAGPRERKLIIIGALGSVVTLVVVKSVLTLALVPALILALPRLDRRRAILVGGVAMVAAIGLVVGRWDDVSNVVRSRDPQPTAPGARALTLPDSYQGGSFVHRIALGYAGVHAVGVDPVLGQGWLSTPQGATIARNGYDQLMLDRFPLLTPDLYLSSYPTHFHMAYLQIAAEAGIPALFLFVVLLAAALSRGLRAEDRSQDVWIRAGLGWLTLMVAHYFGEAVFGASINAATLGMGLAICAGGVSRPLQRRNVMRSVATIVAICLSSLLVLEGTGAAEAPATARVVLREVRGGVVVENGLARLAIRGGTVTLAALDAHGAVIGGEVPLRDDGARLRVTGLEVLEQRSRSVTLRGRDARGRQLTMSLVLGVHGIYLASAASQRTLGIDLGSRSVVLGGGAASALGRSRTWIASPLSPGAIADPARQLLAVVVSERALAFTAGREGLSFHPRPAGASLTFVGVSGVRGAVFRRPARGASLLPGSYEALLGSGERGLLRTEAGRAPAKEAWRGAIPLDIDAADVEGVEELTEEGRIARSYAACDGACAP